MSAGEFVRDHLSGSRFAMIEAHGHCPHLSAPADTVKAIREFLGP